MNIKTLKEIVNSFVNISLSGTTKALYDFINKYNEKCKDKDIAIQNFLSLQVVPNFKEAKSN